LLIDQIEILRGPATLLFGSGASGGVVNLIDNRIPEQVPDAPLTGAFEVRGNTVADETSGVFRLDGGGGSWAWHLDGSWRDSDDYKIPGMAEREIGDHAHDEHDDHHDDDHHDDHHGEESKGRLENSFVESQSGTFGLSFIGDRGFIGASVRHFTSDYGIPAPHMHGGEHSDDDHDESHDDDHHDDDHHDHDSHGEEAFASIDLEQTSFDVKAGLSDPFAGFERLTFRAGYNDYRHEEIEMEGAHGEDTHGESDHDHADDHMHGGTVFDIETIQARVELEMEELAGWVGAFGIQYDNEDFNSVGAEAYVAPNTTESLALFALQEKTWGDFTLSLGARVESTEVKASMEAAHHDEHHDEHDHDHDHDHHDDFSFDQTQREFTAVSASVGGIWQLNNFWQGTANFSYSQRAPSASELFANGPHLATFAFERGDDALVKETSHAWDFGVHRHSADFDFKANVFHKDISDFIYWAETDEMLDGFPLRLASQADAELYGTELMANWQIHETRWGDFDVHASHDWVRGKLTNGENLPRISPERVQLGLDWHAGPWRAALEWQHVFDQKKTAMNEPPTPGYDLINARLAYAFDLGGAEMTAFIEGKNLGNEEARVHTSYLRDYAPLPGRNFIAGLRGRF